MESIGIGKDIALKSALKEIVNVVGMTKLAEEKLQQSLPQV
jgi:hypothetical protein